MSERPIQVGDLVYVYRDCCGAHRMKTFTVESIQAVPMLLICLTCSHTEPSGTPLTQPRAFPLDWLRRIPPVEEIDRMELAEQIEQHQRILERIAA